jgi:hypothetical protein
MEMKINRSTNYNLIAYIVFLCAGIYFSFIASSIESGPMFICLAFIFDPFDQKTSFYKRPIWQQIIFYSHFILLALSLAYLLL